MLSILLVAILAQNPQSPKVESKYECSGNDLDGSAYQLPLTIQTKGENLFFTWGQGETVGMGFRVENRLVVAFVNATGGVGVMTYTIQGGTLEGKWSIGNGTVQTENCNIPGLRVAGGGDEKELSDTDAARS